MGLGRREFCSAVLAAMFGSRLCAEEVAAPTEDASWTKAFEDMTNLTAGGMQFWGDECFFHDWRIQRHCVTGHCRLLDSKNHRHASGPYDACRAKLAEIRDRDGLPAMSGKAILILHGLFRTRNSMTSLRKSLTAAGGYTVFCMGYPTTRGSVADHARSLDSVISSLEGISEINFMAHSLGNLVVRHWLQDLAEQKRTLPEGQKFGRMVMLAPPNHHPKIAATLIRGALANFVAGQAAEQLATGWEGLSPKLGTPQFEFGILAGGKGDDNGWNPLLPGDDDGVVTVESTRLSGARDFRLVPALHSFFMDDKRVQEYALRFIQHGHFESDETRQPVETL